MLKLVAKNPQPFIDIDDLKANLRVVTSDENIYLHGLAKTACLYVQEVSGKKLNEDSYSFLLPSFPKCIELPLTPVKIIDSISYYDSDNLQQSLDLSLLSVIFNEDKTVVEGSFPQTYERSDAVEIRFTTGIPDTQEYPENLKHAAILLASHWYEKRTVAGEQLHDIPFGFDSLINISKIGWY